MIDRLYSEFLKMNWCMEVKIPCASFCSNVKQNFNSGDFRTIYCQFPFFWQFYYWSIVRGLTVKTTSQKSALSTRVKNRCTLRKAPMRRSLTWIPSTRCRRRSNAGQRDIKDRKEKSVRHILSPAWSGAVAAGNYVRSGTQS